MAALVVTAVPVAMGSFSTLTVPTSHTPAPRVSASALVSTAPIEQTASALQRHYLSRPAPGAAPQAVAPQVTIAAGLALGTKAERNRKIAVSSSKGSRVWTASDLAEHGLPSAAKRAYKNAARELSAVDPGCNLPWTLLAGIGRVESDHGRYGGSVLGRDGVPRPAIIGVALNGKGPVAAIRDSDKGAFDGDKVWDRAVGPMQFIPTTWKYSGRDGDGDGKESPNDIDDAARAAASYLCNGGGDLRYEGSQKSAIFSYNPSDYYVALVMAFERGYRTGVFVIPSPEVADDVAHRKAKKHAPRKHAAKHRTVRHTAKAVSRPRVQAPVRRTSTTSQPKPSAPKPSAPKPPAPSPTPVPPKLYVVEGLVVLVDTGGWKVDTLKLTPDDLGPIASQDYDKDGTIESVALELDGLAAAGVRVSVSYYTLPTFKVNGFSLS